MPLVRSLRCAQFRRLRPLQDGQTAGTPIVRDYWARFLSANRADFRRPLP
ncbi:MAG: hypothetical protein M5R40_27755 [Anaerolineae bacterium]|nr:hypothetical protein [Anaerolineae bacterium]